MTIEIKKDPERLVGHPIRVYRLIRDLYKFFDGTYKNMKPQGTEKGKLTINPTTRFYHSAIRSLIAVFAVILTETICS